MCTFVPQFEHRDGYDSNVATVLWTLHREHVVLSIVSINGIDFSSHALLKVFRDCLCICAGAGFIND